MDKFKYQSIEFIHLFCSSLGEEEKILDDCWDFLLIYKKKIDFQRSLKAVCFKILHVCFFYKRQSSVSNTYYNGAYVFLTFLQINLYFVFLY